MSGRRLSAVALISVACALPERDTQAPTELDSGVRDPERETSSPSRDDGPCGRSGTVVLPDGRIVSYGLPCRPYDRVRDLPMPADKVPGAGE